ncbi:hypothetical protein B296_00057317 [Ensete ventricosum]|uniref:Uncharacterized protein n=1 Tax=Ensete ventricosum TaxID=4639 RepID=A0A426WVN4_ENSVE|nr:hypothetical protein B296_00057317 [Ensete ventricosum]
MLWRPISGFPCIHSWRYLVVFLGECRGVGIIPTRNLFMACFRFCKSRGGYYLTARVGFRVSGAPSNNKDQMDLGELRGMPKVTSGKVPPTRPTAREVGASPAREAPKASLKRPVVASTEQAEDAARRHKKVKVLTRRHKSRLGEGESHSRSKGKEPAVPSEEPKAPADQHFQMSLFNRVHDAGRLITFMDYRIKQLQEELDAMKSNGSLQAVAKVEERTSELQEELEKTKREEARSS